MNTIRFGKRIRELRVLAGFSQRYVTEKAGISVPYLSKVEKGNVIPARKVIVRLAELFSVDRDELLTLAGKLPQDIAERLHDNPELLKALREGRVQNTGNGAAMKDASFGERLRELRLKAGLSQGDLAEQTGISTPYLSKIESGAKPAPSQKIIYKLAEALDIDSDELLAISGKVPSDVIEQLQDNELLHALRSTLTNTYQTRRPRSMQFVKNLFNVRRLSRVAVPVMLVVAVAASLVFSAPLPVKALDFEFTPASPSVTAGSAMTFKVKVKVQNTDKLPVQGVKVLFSDKKYGSTTYENEFTNLPLIGSGAVTKNSVSGPANTISVSSTTSAAWGGDTDSRYGYGYGYSTSQGWGWRVENPLNTGYGYGYAYLANVGEAWIEYTITWTPPTNWPTGTYYITAYVLGNGDGSYLFAEDAAFTIAAAAPAPVIIAGGTTTTQDEPEETEPGTWSTEDVVDDEGTFTATTTVQDKDDKVSVTIPQGVKGTTTDGEKITQVKVEAVDPETLPAPPTAITGKKNVMVMSYNIDVNNGKHVNFDQAITLEFSYNDADVPAGVDENDLTVAWFDEANNKWVELPTVVDPVTNKLTVQVDHLSKWAVMVAVDDEEEPEVTVEPISETVDEEDTTAVEEEDTTTTVEEEDTTTTVEEDTTTVDVEPAATEDEEETGGGMAWWLWLIIGIAVVAIIVVGYIYWWKPRMA